MKKPLIAISLALVSIGLISAPASAADQKTVTNAADTKFIKEVGEANKGELKMAELGAQKAERAEVKEFATMLVTDHTKCGTELTNLAQSKGVEMSAIVAPGAAEAFKDLEQKSGKDFDKAFLDKMIDEHQDLISKFEDMQKDATDAELKSWIDATLPKLKSHLERAKELNK